MEQYNGPITFLTMLYTYEYQKKYGTFGSPVTTPAVNYITTTTLARMEKYLYNNEPPLDDDSENEEYAPAYENVENEEANVETANKGLLEPTTDTADAGKDDVAAAGDIAAAGEIAATGDKIIPEAAADNIVDIHSADKPAETVGEAPAGENVIRQPDTDGDNQKQGNKKTCYFHLNSLMCISFNDTLTYVRGRWGK
ncbi:uncharacterized protein LOC143537965 [Bidens hawaiensis]|uniref:uncharacterized protein LOC143537965 n=1 Tax=Bidens hawaiensis TaxID=980011 RepID=UPI00404A9BCB